MDKTTLAATIAAKIQEHSLLKHPFYQAWSQGTLPLEALKQYAAQYYHFEAAFPTFLSAVHSRVADQKVRQQILSNLWDEEYGEANHTALWLRFCEALGLDTAAIPGTPVQAATAQLISTYRDLCANGHYSQGLAALLAYESQAPEVARQKAAGLKAYYGIQEPHAIAFFTVHTEQDTGHAATERSLVLDAATSADEQATVLAAVDKATEALWAFLDGVYEAERVQV